MPIEIPIFNQTNSVPVSSPKTNLPIFLVTAMMWSVLTLLVIFAFSPSTSSQDCDSPSLSVKSRRQCMEGKDGLEPMEGKDGLEPMEGKDGLKLSSMNGAEDTTAPAQDLWDEDARERHFKASINQNGNISESSTSRTTTTTVQMNETPEAIYITTTPDPFAEHSDYNETFPCGLEQSGESCKNESEPIIRWKDPVFEKLIKQIWNDHQAKITEDKSVEGIGLDPLVVDPLIPGGKVAVNYTAWGYGAELSIWDVKIYGLPSVHLSQALVTRASDLSDLEMTMTLSFSSMSANGTYDLDGWFSWWTVNSGGPQPFDVDITNATITARITLDTTVGDGTGCGTDGGVLITDLGLPFNHDDISIHFHNMGATYNTMINGIGMYLIKLQETAIVGAIKNKIREDVNSLLC